MLYGTRISRSTAQITRVVAAERPDVLRPSLRATRLLVHPAGRVPSTAREA